MHQPDWNLYLQQIQQQLNQQEIRIKRLEQQIAQLNELTEKQKGVTIEKIEYKFDQLKVETLSGSLHIGLSPEELSNIEELALNQQTKPISTRDLESINQDILDELNNWCHDFGADLIRQLADEIDLPLKDSQIALFIQDIQSQLPKRILYHQQELKKERSHTDDQQIKAVIIDKIKQEIYQSLKHYLKSQKDLQ